MILVREGWPEDIEAIRIVNEQAFGQPAEVCTAAILDRAAMAGAQGAARYRDEFDEAI